MPKSTKDKMNSKLNVYNFNVSGPFPDENGKIMQGTAFRVESLKGRVSAYDTKQAVMFFLNCPQVKAIADYNKIDIEPIINGVNPNNPNMLSIVILDNGLTVSFSLLEKENML